MKLTAPQPPSLPLATNEYDRRYQDQLNNVLRLYFTRLNSVVSSVVGNEGGQYLSFPYGSFYDTTTQSAAAINTAYVVTFNTESDTNSVKISPVVTSRLVVDEQGLYNYAFAVQLHNTGILGGSVNLWARQNGTDRVYSARKESVAASAYLTVMGSFLPSLNANDYIELVWSTDNMDIKIQPIASPAVGPSVPSATMIVNFISVPPTNASM